MLDNVCNIFIYVKIGHKHEQFFTLLNMYESSLKTNFTCKLTSYIGNSTKKIQFFSNLICFRLPYKRYFDAKVEVVLLLCGKAFCQQGI